MAIVILGKTRCAVCNKPILKGDEFVSFPAFVGNKLNPLSIYSDAAVHTSCIENDELGQLSLNVVSQLDNLFQTKQCCICNQTIAQPKDYFFFGYLTHNRNSPVYRVQFSHVSSSTFLYMRSAEKTLSRHFNH